MDPASAAADRPTDRHAPAVGCALDRGRALVSGGGTVLQRPVQLEGKVRMEPKDFIRTICQL